MDGNKGSGPSLGAVFGTLKEGVFGRVTAFPDCILRGWYHDHLKTGVIISGKEILLMSAELAKMRPH